MIEIKFRHWNKASKVMTAGHDVRTLIKFWVLEGEYNLIWMQYTGLKDKNGKEIYEGDILAIENEGQIMAVCEKKPGYFTLVDRAGGEWTRQLFHQPERLSVIGNIHENPELLNSEEEETGNN